jgi:hypothetical protein
MAGIEGSVRSGGIGRPLLSASNHPVTKPSKNIPALVGGWEADRHLGSRTCIAAEHGRKSTAGSRALLPALALRCLYVVRPAFTRVGSMPRT